MPYYRRRYGAKRYSGGRKRATRKRIAAVTRRVVNRMAEVKTWAIHSTSNWTSAATWQFGSAITGMGTDLFQQGTAANQRIGDTITLRKITFMITLRPLTNIPVNGSICRVVLYHNKQANYAKPSPTAVFDSDTFNTDRNQAQIKRFSILKDYSHAMVVTGNNAGSTYSVGPPVYFMWTIYPKKKIQYTANNGTINDVLLDDYGYGYCADGACCYVDIATKMYFTDS